jgi:predicted ATPase
VIASIQFRSFKALRAAGLRLEPFNLIIGPNGSGKTSLIQAILRLRALSQQSCPATEAVGAPLAGAKKATAELLFTFMPPHARVSARVSGVSGLVCDQLQVSGDDGTDWAEVQAQLQRVRVFLFDHYAMAAPAAPESGRELAANGGNLASVLYAYRTQHPSLYAALETEAVRLMPEFTGIELRHDLGVGMSLGMRLCDEDEILPAEALSQGNLYTLALLALTYDPNPPSIVCIEEVDRGIHPRRLRDVRDLLYRLSYPAACGLSRQPVQVIATTHSPYLLDQFRDHPEEIVIAEKNGRSATFARLIDRPDLEELLREGSLGDMWFAGVLGGVPEEREL